MRLLHIFVPRENRSLVLETLETEDIEYAVTEESGPGGFEALVAVPIAPAGVEPVLAKLHEAGLDDDAYTAVVAAETIVSGREEELTEQFTGKRISREELRSRAVEFAPASSTYYTLLLLSTVIATTGLLLDSAATIIGAMVVAPLMGPALAASVGIVVDDDRLANRDVRLQIFGLLAAVGTAAIVGYLLKGTMLLPPAFDVTTVPEVRERITPGVLALALALGSGAAGVISLTRNVGSVLVGVAIAVALIPPAATAGLGIAWGHPEVILTAGTLVLVNLLSINLTALLLLWLSGYRPPEPDTVQRVYGRLRTRLVGLLVVIAVLSVVLAGVTIGTYQTAAVEHDVQTELEEMSDDPAYDALEFRELDFEYELYDVYSGTEPTVTIVVERPPGVDEPPAFAEMVRDRLEDASGTDLEVVLELIDTQRA